MSIINNLFGNATEVDTEKLQSEFGEIIIDGEEIEAAFKIFRDKWVFTNKRLIMLNVQGVTGSKREYHSIPYSSITHFSIETGGTFDGDCEMKLWVRGLSSPMVKEFKRNLDIKGLQRMLAKHILK
ncbi:MAG: PH domain-containing protein [Alistipes sp.]|nr:PH domain-containing protein [Alistipes sp.]